FERWTIRERLRRGHCDLLSFHRLCPAETRLKEGANALDSDRTGGNLSLAAGWWRPVSALPEVSRDCHFDVKRGEGGSAFTRRIVDSLCVNSASSASLRLTLARFENRSDAEDAELTQRYELICGWFLNQPHVVFSRTHTAR